jgi:predicted amidohydrolase YtcJ
MHLRLALVVWWLAVPASAQDLVLFGGKVWTGATKNREANNRKAEAVVVVAGRVRYVGDSATAKQRAPAGARRIDLAGRRVLPGLIDSHVHFLTGGDELLAPDLRSAKTEEEFARRLGAAAKKVPAGTWMTGGTWDHENWPDGRLPTRKWLDRFVPDHPVFVSRLDGHMAVANSLAIRRAKVSAKTKDPKGGTIVRGADGEPAGVFKDTAMILISRHVPAWTPKQRLRRARVALRHAASLGITGVHDMLTSYSVLRTYQDLRDRGELTTRITYYTPIGSHERWGAVRIQRGFGDAFLKLGGLKGFADGSLGSTTAWFFEPYSDAPNTSGLPMPALLPEGSMPDDVVSCTNLGLQVAIHAIGDRANRRMLDIFAGGGDALRKLRPRLEHAQHIHPDDLARFAKLGVIASMQAYHAIDDGRWAEKRIGAERCQTTYAFRSLLERGATLAFGSDWPVAPLSPWSAIYAAVTRRTLDGKNPEGWVPSEKITVEQAITAYTRGSAYAAFDEKELGTLVAGKLADLIVLDRDPFAIPAAEIRDVRVDLTVVGGRVVHER